MLRKNVERTLQLQTRLHESALDTVTLSTTVRSGQTLSEVAATQLPGLPVADAVARIQVANDLASDQVHAGQILLIPAVR